MNVDGDIIDHPKYLELKEVIKRDALEYLVLIWKHCARNQKGEFWEGASANYLEKAARWHGEPKKLYKTLINTGWIHQEETGIRIHDWEQMNSHTVKAWVNGARGGRPKRLKDKATNNPSVPPDETHGLSQEKPIGSTSDNPSVPPATTDGLAGQQPMGTSPANPSGGRSEVNEVKGGERAGAGAPARVIGPPPPPSPPQRSGQAESEKNGPGQTAGKAKDPPTESEVVEAGVIIEAPEAYCRRFYAKQCEGHWWIRNGQLIDWLGLLKRWWGEERDTWAKRKNGAAFESKDPWATEW